MAGDGPDFRISDDDRNDAVEALGEHLRTGRLNVDEYGERTAQVTTAKTRGELIPLFTDLPDPRPKVLSGQLPDARRPDPAPARRRSQPPQQRLTSLAVPIAAVVAIALFLTVAKGFWLVFLLPAAVAVLVGSSSRCRP